MSNRVLSTSTGSGRRGRVEGGRIEIDPWALRRTPTPGHWQGQESGESGSLTSSDTVERREYFVTGRPLFGEAMLDRPQGLTGGRRAFPWIRGGKQPLQQDAEGE